MAEKKILVIIKSQPYSNLNYYEALRTAIGLWEHEVTILWRADGVYATLEKADRKITEKLFSEFQDMDTGLFVNKEDLEFRGFTSEDLLKDIQPLNNEQTKTLIEKAETSLVF